MRKFLIYFVGIPAALYGLWRLNYPSYTWWQNTTLTIEAPNGVHSGTGSVKVGWTAQPKVLPDFPRWLESISGEATMVGLGNGKYVFALLGDARSVGLRLFEDRGYHSSKERVSDWRQITFRHRDEPPLDLPRRDYPALVTFADIDVPASVKQVDPDDMDSALGCDRPTNEPKPWVEAKMLWWHWTRWQASGLSLEKYISFANGRAPADLDIKVKAKIDQFAPKARDTSNDCYRLDTIQLAIASSPAAEVQLEKVLEWLPTRQFLIPPEVARTLKDTPFRLHVGRNDLITGEALYKIRIN